MSLVMYRLYLSRSKDTVVLLYAVLIQSVAVVIENRRCIDFIACHQPERVQGGFHVAVMPEFRLAISSLMPIAKEVPLHNFLPDFAPKENILL